MAHVLQCRLCHKPLDIESEPYTLIGQKSYYHKKCYDDWVSKKNDPKSILDADFWYESVVDYLYRDVKLAIDFAKLQSQWKNFTKPDKKMTPKGIYFSLRYFYEIQHGDKDKSLGGIGIVPSIYKESAAYWTDLEMRKKGTIDAIIAQIKERQERPIALITRTNKKKDKSKYDLNDI